ncbi:MAG: RNA 2',3'-cyclic phosphodiesterase [Actinobacteria bacterium]|nr:MAG: RNA 2',3'-cyclic phosphodiesterase [Actinomycetota bacterium]
MRLFVALDLPLAVRTSLGAWAAQAVGRDDRLRLIDERSLHLTLVFLGERPDAGAATTALDAALDSPPAPPLTVDSPLWLAPRRPHVLTVSLADPSGGLARIQADVLDAMVRDAGHEGERRSFRPHITVARVRGRLRPFELPAPPSMEFHPPSVTLYRSVLASGPASYEAMASVALSTLP